MRSCCVVRSLFCLNFELQNLLSTKSYEATVKEKGAYKAKWSVNIVMILRPIRVRGCNDVNISYFYLLEPC